NEKNLLDIVAKYSPINFHELRWFYCDKVQSKLLPEELESFFITWMNRIPQIPLTFITVNCKQSLINNDENMKIIEKYIRLGIIKFKAIDNYIHDFNEYQFSSFPFLTFSNSNKV